MLSDNLCVVCDVVEIILVCISSVYNTTYLSINKNKRKEKQYGEETF